MRTNRAKWAAINNPGSHWSKVYAILRHRDESSSTPVSSYPSSSVFTGVLKSNQPRKRFMSDPTGLCLYCKKEEQHHTPKKKFCYRLSLIDKLHRAETGEGGFGTIVITEEGFSPRDFTHNLVIYWLNQNRHKINALNVRKEIHELKKSMTWKQKWHRSLTI